MDHPCVVEDAQVTEDARQHDIDVLSIDIHASVKGSAYDESAPHENEELLTGALTGDVAAVALLLQKGSYVNAVSNTGKTALMFAARGNHALVLDLLLKKGAAVNSFDSDGRTALHDAAQHSDLDVVKALLDHSAEVSTQNSLGITPLLIAVQRAGTLEVIKILLQRGANINYAAHTDGLTALMIASFRGDIAVVSFLLECSASVNAKNPNNGASAIYLAAVNGHAEVAGLLLDKNADTSFATTNDNTTPLFISVLRCHLAVVELLLKRGAAVDQKCTEDEIPPLYFAAALSEASASYIPVVEMLLDFGADANFFPMGTESDMTIVMQAVYHRNVPLLRLLVHRGVDVNSRGGIGATALHIAARSGHIPSVALLLEGKAELNVVETGGHKSTALFDAAAYGHVGVMEMLLTAGAKTTHESAGNFPLLVGAGNGNLPVVEILLAFKADVNETNSDGASALQYAMEANHIPIINLLVHFGARVHRGDEPEEVLSSNCQ